jgi:hypothetical protein
MTVSEQDRRSMERLLLIMNGQTPPPDMVNENMQSHSSTDDVFVNSPGTVSQKEINAMAEVLRRLDGAVTQTSHHMVTESAGDRELKEALQTTSDHSGVKIGVYKIKTDVDETRTAGKQYHSVVNSVTGDVLAHELSLYEAAHGLVRMLNSGLYINSRSVRELLEAEATYTSHRIDAIRFNRQMKKCVVAGDINRAQLMETRKQSSLDKASQAKRQVKKIYGTT